jgi:mannose-6-phosphate isomerase-like protein (cupin superfamily)
MPVKKFTEFSNNLQNGSAFLSAAPDGKTDSIPEASVSYIEMPSGGEVRPHTHNRVEVYVFLTGRATAMAGETITEVSTGDVLIAPIGTAHALRVIGSEPLRYYAFNAPPASTCPMVPAPEEIQWKWNKGTI